jgi:hypothetical protein
LDDFGAQRTQPLRPFRRSDGQRRARERRARAASKQEILAVCIAERVKRLRMPVDLPEPLDRKALSLALTAFGSNLLREISNPIVIAVFRLAIAEAVGESCACRLPGAAFQLREIT